MRLALTGARELTDLINLEGNGGQFSIAYWGSNQFADFGKGCFSLRGWCSTHKDLFS
jgi:hypothetical protein